MSLSPDDVRDVASLARLAVTDAEASRYAVQLSDLLAQFDRLSELDTDGVPAMSHAVPVVARLRADVAQPSLPRATVLSQAPKSDPWLGGFVVPQVIAE